MEGNSEQYAECIGGPLDGAGMELNEGTENGFVCQPDKNIYHYDLKYFRPQGGYLWADRKFVLVEVCGAKKQPRKRKKGGA